MFEKLPRLYYLSDNEPTLLPEWSYFFIRLGYQLAAMPNKNHRFVIGLAIPTRVFACSLVATGITFAKTRANNIVDEAHLQYILSLKPGTSVYIRTEYNMKLRGVIEENGTEINGNPYIFIRTAELGKRMYPIDRYASRITVSVRDVNLPKYQQTGRHIESPSEFAQICLGKELANKYIHSSSFEVLLIGKVSIIQHEICDIPFICNVTNKSAGVKGYLQEILRVRQFSGTNKSYRIECVSSSDETPEKKIKGREPSITIFDGAVAYIKHAHKWRNTHQIVLLDRTERQFSDATELLNQNYAYRLADDFRFSIKIPNGIEMMIYKE